MLGLETAAAGVRCTLCAVVKRVVARMDRDWELGAPVRTDWSFGEAWMRAFLYGCELFIWCCFLMLIFWILVFDIQVFVF